MADTAGSAAFQSNTPSLLLRAPALLAAP